MSTIVDLSGAITSHSSHRSSEGAIHESARVDHGRGILGAAFLFSVAVKSGHSGIVEIRPLDSSSAHTCTLIPLGADRPFLESELPPSAGADGAYSQSETVVFHFSKHVLTWTTDNMTGRVVLSAQVPSVCVSLRLAAGNIGTVSPPAPVPLASTSRAAAGTSPSNCSPESRAHWT